MSCLADQQMHTSMSANGCVQTCFLSSVHNLFHKCRSMRVTNTFIPSGKAPNVSMIKFTSLNQIFIFKSDVNGYNICKIHQNTIHKYRQAVALEWNKSYPAQPRLLWQSCHEVPSTEQSGCRRGAGRDGKANSGENCLDNGSFMQFPIPSSVSR
jgi:hypothetical protein